jgi:DNA-directed RNA polymerase specialized sigma24 family protein
VDIEKFINNYRDHVYRWVKWENRRQKNFYYEEDEFWSSLIEKFIKKNSLKFFKEGKVKFLTWLNAVLMNHYIDGMRKHKPYVPIVSAVDEIKSEKALSENTFGFEKWSQENTEINFDKVEELVEKIEDLKLRLLMKLLMFNPLFTIFSPEEKQFLANNYDVSENEIDSTIEKIFESNQKIRHKDIADLTGYAIGSIGQTFDRAVRKYVIEPYLSMRISP